MDVAVDALWPRLSARRATSARSGCVSASSRLGPAEHAVRAGAGDGDAHLRPALGDEHADQRIARGRVAELLVAGLRARSGTMILVMISPSSSAVSNRPVKKSSAAILRLLVTIVAPSAEAGRRVIGGRIVVGDRAADRAAMAHMRVADQRGQLGEAGNGLLHARRVGDVGMVRHGADRRRCGPCSSMPVEFGAAAEIDQMRAARRAAASSSGAACGRRPGAWRPRSCDSRPAA